MQHPMRVVYSVLAALALAGGAAAQTYPDKPIKIISPFSAGGPADIYARYLGQRADGQAVKSRLADEPQRLVEDRLAGAFALGHGQDRHGATK